MKRFLEDLKGTTASSMFRDDRHSMAAEGGNFFSLLIVNGENREKRLVSGYTSDEYERVIDAMLGKGFEKKTPIDIIEYLDRRKGYLVTAREISEVFKTEESDAERRLSGLSGSGFLEKEVAGWRTYWALPEGKTLDKLTLEQVNLSHVTERAKVTEPAKLEQVVRDAVKKLYTEVAEKPRGVSSTFPLGVRAQELPGIQPRSWTRYPRQQLSLSLAWAIPTRRTRSVRGTPCSTLVRDQAPTFLSRLSELDQRAG